VATQVAGNTKEVVVVHMAECAFCGVWSQVVGSVLVRLAGIWLQSPGDVFTFNSVYKYILQM
jgi:hypothetical protein